MPRQIRRDEIVEVVEIVDLPAAGALRKPLPPHHRFIQPLRAIIADLLANDLPSAIRIPAHQHVTVSRFRRHIVASHCLALTRLKDSVDQYALNRLVEHSDSALEILSIKRRHPMIGWQYSATSFDIAAWMIGQPTAVCVISKQVAGHVRAAPAGRRPAARIIMQPGTAW